MSTLELVSVIFPAGILAVLCITLVVNSYRHEYRQYNAAKSKRERMTGDLTVTILCTLDLQSDGTGLTVNELLPIVQAAKLPTMIDLAPEEQRRRIEEELAWLLSEFQVVALEGSFGDPRNIVYATR